jgi:hypothetical protein
MLQGKNSEKSPVMALTRLKAALQVIDSIWVRAKFRYTDEQRNFSARTAEFYG